MSCENHSIKIFILKYLDKSWLFLLICLILGFSLFSTAFAAKQGQSISLIYCKPNEFRLTSGDYVIEYGEQTDKKILIYKPSTKGALSLRFLGGGSELNLLNSIKNISCFTDSDTIVVTMKGSKTWANYEIKLYQYRKYPGLLRWTLQLTPLQCPPAITTSPELRLFQRKDNELIPVKAGNFIIGIGPRHPTYLYAKQAPFAAPLIYLCSPGWIGGTLFYFEDLTSLNNFFKLTRSGPERIMVDIYDSESSFGYIVPNNIKSLPIGKKVTLTDSYLYLSSHYPSDEADVALNFFSFLSTIYDFINKPFTELTDWRSLAHQVIKDLNNSELWVNINDRPYLRAYVNDKRKSAELITQLDLLLALTKYEMHYDGVTSIVKKLTRTLPSFYAEQYNALNNNFPNSEKGDSWYLIEEMTQLAKLAKLGNKVAKEVLLKSIKSTITLAHNVGYEFPNHFSYINLEPTFGIEQDVAGGYAYLMLELYDLMGDKKFLDEAKEAIKHIRGKYFGLNYEMQITAMGATAAARLYKLTGEKKYLRMSYMPLANIMFVSWLWESNYGYAKSYSTFFGLSPMLHSGVITMKEQYEVWSYLTEYLCLVQGELPDYVEKLLCEFYRYTLYILKYTLPALLPPEAVALYPTSYSDVKLNDPSIYIPLEDLRHGLSKSGLIGQQIYGAGGPITFAIEAYKEIRPGLTIYSEYAVVQHSDSTFTLGGTPNCTVWVEMFGDNLPSIYDGQMQEVKEVTVDKNRIKFKARGGQTYYLGRH